MKPLLLRHLSGESIGRFPVWMMRQAGRYLPQYRAVREKHSFWEMVSTPALAMEVSLQPLDVIPVDGVIFFSDILTLPYGMGMPVEMKESIGPVVLNPLRTEEAFQAFREYRPESHTKFVGDTLTGIREKIGRETTLLGFAGAPWTVGCYLIEGRGKTHFTQIKNWLHRDPQNLAAALSPFADATLEYLKYQHRSGAHLVQLFDTWLAEMPRPFFVAHYLPLLNRIFTGLKEAGIPAIYFAKRAHHLLGDFQELDVPALSVDELLPLREVEKRTGGKFSLQGNLDPLLLLGDEATVRKETRKLVQEARGLAKPAILNLGHGVLPGASVENVKAFVQEARALWV